MPTTYRTTPLAHPHRHVWLVLKHGRVFARLDDARVADMFWLNYRVSDLTGDERDRLLLFSEAFWHAEPLPTFKHEQSGIVCTTAFAGGLIPSAENPRVSIRGLYSPVDPRGWRALLSRWGLDCFVRLIRTL